MPPSYSVQKVHPEQAQAPAARIWKDNLPISGDAVSLFAWKYLEPPEVSAVHCLLKATTEKGEETVGSAGLCPRPFDRGEKPLRAALMADLAVDRPHRTLLPALTLVKEAVAEALQRFDFAYGFPNQLSVGLFLRAGFQKLGTMTRYACVLHHRDYVQRTLKNPLLSALVSFPLDLFKLARLWPRTIATLGRYRLESSVHLDDQLDSLVLSLQGKLPLLGARTARWLRWKYFSASQPHAQVHQLYRRGGPTGALCGYAITRDEGGVTHIMDLLASPDELPVLLDHLLSALFQKGATSASFRFLGAEQVVSTLRSRGFVPRESEQAVIFAQGRAGSLGVDPAAMSTWHLTHADEDV